MSLATLFRLDLAAKRELSKKVRESLAQKLKSFEFLSKLGTKRISEMDELANSELELEDDLKLEIHVQGCAHFSCKSPDDRKLNQMARTVAVLARAYEEASVPREMAMRFYIEQKDSLSECRNVVKKAVNSDFEKSLRDTFASNVSIDAIKISISPSTSEIIDKKRGAYVLMEEIEVSFAQLQSESTLVDLLRKQIENLKKTLMVK